MREPEQPPSVGFHPAATRVVTFGPFRFDFADRTLAGEQGEIPLPPRGLAILAYLLERPGRIVSKAALMDAVWKDAHVSETSLTEAVGVVRQALGDDPQQSRYIQTVHRRGYRFVAPISVEAPQAPALGLVPDVAARTGESSTVETSRTAPRWRAGVPGLAVLGFALLVAGVVAWMAWRPSPAARATRVVITLPPEQAPAPGLNAHTVLALAPDARRIVYVAGTTGSYRLFLRALDRFDAAAIAGTDGAHGPFFSTDGGWIGFFRAGRLLKIRPDGGAAVPLAEAVTGFGGSWSGDGTIVYAPGGHEGLWRVDADGGEPMPLTRADEGESHRWPDVLPDGRTIVFTIWRLSPADARVAAWRPGMDAPVTLVERAAHPRYLETGHLGFLRDGTLMVAPFDAGSLRVTGPAVAAVTNLMTGLTGAGQFSVAADALLYLPDDPERRNRNVVRVDARGTATALPLPPRPYQNLVLSPAGRRLATTIPAAGGVDIWIGDVSRGSLSRFTFGGTNLDPVWSPDGRHLTFGSNRTGNMEIYRQPLDDGTPEPLWTHPHQESPGSWSPDGRSLAFLRLDPATGADIHLAGAEASSKPLVATRATETWPRISPDGRWLAYQSNESGRPEVYVRALAGGGREQVSTDGGTAPAWVPGTAALTFQKGTEILTASIGMDPAGHPAPEAPRRVLQDPEMILARPAPDGTFIVLRRLREHHPLTTLNLVLGWTRELGEAK